MTQQFQVTIINTPSSDGGSSSRPDKISYKLPVKQQLDGEWEVALMEIQYPNSGQNVQEDLEFGLVIVGLGISRDEEVDSFDQYVYDECIGILKGGPYEKYKQNLEKYSDETQELFSLTRHGTKIYMRMNFGYRRLKIPAGHYKSIENLIDIFNLKIAEAYTAMGADMTKVNPILQLRFDEHLDRMVGNKPGYPVALFTKGRALRTILGIGGENIHGNTWAVIKNAFCGTHSPELEMMPIMFIYSNIIKHQIVGDTITPLLGIVPVQGGPREECQWTFSPPFYFPLKCKELDHITFKLKTETGAAYHLRPHDKIMARLHFRQRHHLV